MELGGGEGRGERKGVFSPRPGILHSLRLPQTRASIWASASRHPLPSRRLSLATAPPPFCSSFCFSLSLSIRHYGRRNACLLSFFFPPPKVDQTETRSSASIALFLIGRDGGGAERGARRKRAPSAVHGAIDVTFTLIFRSIFTRMRMEEGKSREYEPVFCDLAITDTSLSLIWNLSSLEERN